MLIRAHGSNEAFIFLWKQSDGGGILQTLDNKRCWTKVGELVIGSAYIDQGFVMMTVEEKIEDDQFL